MTESGHSRELRKRLAFHPALRHGTVWKVNDRITPGVSDFIIFVEGKTVFIEAKRHKTTYEGDPLDACTAKQAAFLRRQSDNGFHTYVLISCDDRPGGGDLWYIGRDVGPSLVVSTRTWDELVETIVTEVTR